MNKVRCPLCGKQKSVLIESLKTQDIIKAYKKQLNIDVTDEFTTTNKIEYYSCLECNLEYFIPMVSGSWKLYEDLQRYAWYYLDEKDEYNIALKFIKKKDSLLEVGAGRGSFRSLLKGVNYTGLEKSENAIKMARETRIRLLNTTIEEYSISNKKKFDVVCSFQVLEHVENIHGFLSASVACIKKHGFLIISVPSGDSFIRHAVNGILNMPPHHQTIWNESSLRKIARLFDLEIVSINHEALSDLHLPWYAYTVAYNSLKAIFSSKSSLIDNSTRHWLLGKCATFLGKIYKRGLSENFMRPKGHSVTVAYRKIK